MGRRKYSLYWYSLYEMNMFGTSPKLAGGGSSIALEPKAACYQRLIEYTQQHCITSVVVESAHCCEKVQLHVFRAPCVPCSMAGSWEYTMLSYAWATNQIHSLYYLSFVEFISRSCNVLYRFRVVFLSTVGFVVTHVALALSSLPNLRAVN